MPIAGMLLQWSKNIATSLIFDSTHLLELFTGGASIVRGLSLIIAPYGAFHGEVYNQLIETAPRWVWGLLGLIPGLIQVISVGIGNRKLRFYASCLNVGTLGVIATEFYITNTISLGSALYTSFWVVQIYIASRLFFNPHQYRRRRTDGYEI